MLTTSASPLLAVEAMRWARRITSSNPFRRTWLVMLAPYSATTPKAPRDELQPLTEKSPQRSISIP